MLLATRHGPAPLGTARLNPKIGHAFAKLIFFVCFSTEWDEVLHIGRPSAEMHVTVTHAITTAILSISNVFI